MGAASAKEQSLRHTAAKKAADNILVMKVSEHTARQIKQYEDELQALLDKGYSASSPRAEYLKREISWLQSESGKPGAGSFSIQRLVGKTIFIEVSGSTDRPDMLKRMIENSLAARKVKVASSPSQADFKMSIFVVQDGVDLETYNALIVRDDNMKALVALDYTVADLKTGKVACEDTATGVTEFKQSYIFGFMGPLGHYEPGSGPPKLSDR